MKTGSNFSPISFVSTVGTIDWNEHALNKYLVGYLKLKMD